MKKSRKQSSRITVDAEHKKMILHFENKKNKLSSLKKKYNTLKKKYLIYSNKLEQNCTGEELSKKYLIFQEMDLLKQEIYDIENCKSEIEYYLNISPILIKYYKLNKKKTIMSFFKNPTIESDIEENTPHNKYSKITDFISVKNDFDKEIISNQYNAIINKTYTKNIIDTYYNKKIKCDECKIDKILYHSKGCLVCQNCGEAEFLIIDNKNSNYNDISQDNVHFCYKRINHLNELLTQFQAKESTEIPQYVYDKILVEIKKMRINNLAKLTRKKMKQILRKLKLNKYYEHIAHIINKLNGLPPPVMSRELEEKLKYMFKQIQSPFFKYCPKNRINFLSYSYVLYKMCELLGHDEFLPYFTLLKSTEKLHKQDIIWKKITNELKWQFIPTT